jgi:hypothetical protein
VFYLFTRIAAVQCQHPKVNVGFLHGKNIGRARNGKALDGFYKLGFLLGFINREREKARFLMALVESISSLVSFICLGKMIEVIPAP